MGQFLSHDPIKEKTMESPIFILGAHKSGTSLLRALFDGHKDLFVVPIESHYFKHLGWWIQYPFRKQLPKYRTVREFWYEAKQWMIHFNMVEDRLSDSMMAGKFNIPKIDEYLERIFEISTPDEEITESILPSLYCQYVELINFSLYTLSSLKGKRIVEKSVENFEFAVDIEQEMSNPKFIHIVRNPYSNLVSLRKYVNRNQKSYPNLGIPLRVISDSFYHLEKIRE